MRIILLRHGETDWNQERRLQGRQDIKLNEKGLSQAKNVGGYLAETYGSSISSIITSPLNRAVTTAGIVADALSFPKEQIVIEPLFVERDFGSAEGMNYEQTSINFQSGQYPGMENLEELCLRARKAVAKYTEDPFAEQTILVVAHGAIIKGILTQASGGTVHYHDRDMWIENGSFCMLSGPKEAARKDSSLPYDIGHWHISLHNASVGFMGRQLGK